jgi:hypothetical protein
MAFVVSDIVIFIPRFAVNAAPIADFWLLWFSGVEEVIRNKESHGDGQPRRKNHEKL